jgi:hypothetical protein
LKRTLPIFDQSVIATIGVSKKGNTMLLYRTIAPTKFTVYPMDKRKEKEKKIEK